MRGEPSNDESAQCSESNPLPLPSNHNNTERFEYYNQITWTNKFHCIRSGQPTLAALWQRTRYDVRQTNEKCQRNFWNRFVPLYICYLLCVCGWALRHNATHSQFTPSSGHVPHIYAISSITQWPLTSASKWHKANAIATFPLFGRIEIHNIRVVQHRGVSSRFTSDHHRQLFER